MTDTFVILCTQKTNFNTKYLGDGGGVGVSVTGVGQGSGQIPADASHHRHKKSSLLTDDTIVDHVCVR